MLLLNFQEICNPYFDLGVSKSIIRGKVGVWYINAMIFSCLRADSSWGGLTIISQGISVNMLSFRLLSATSKTWKK